MNKTLTALAVIEFNHTLQSLAQGAGLSKHLIEKARTYQTKGLLAFFSTLDNNNRAVFASHLESLCRQHENKSQLEINGIYALCYTDKGFVAVNSKLITYRLPQGKTPKTWEECTNTRTSFGTVQVTHTSITAFQQLERLVKSKYPDHHLYGYTGMIRTAELAVHCKDLKVVNDG